MKPSRNRIRVWDKKHEEWIEPSYMGLDYTGEIVLAGKTLIKGEHISNEDIIICRSTGYCDSESEEIFEGDIVDTGILASSCPKGVWRDIVVWHEDHVQWWLGDDDFGDLDRYVDTPKYKALYPCKVIGNIYENPRLAKKL